MSGLSMSRAPLQASTSSSWSRSGNPSRTRKRSSFQGPRRIFTLPARHCELKGPNLVRLSPLSVTDATVKPPSARTRWSAWLLPACPGSWPNPMRTGLPSCAAVLSSNRSTSPGLGPPAHHIQEPVATALVAAELDADRPIGVVELGLFGGGEIPVAHDIELGWDRVDHAAPPALEIEPGGWPDLPIAAEQPLALERGQ